jgi:hypothetical protein
LKIIRVSLKTFLQKKHSKLFNCPKSLCTNTNLFPGPPYFTSMYFVFFRWLFRQHKLTLLCETWFPTLPLSISLLFFSLSLSLFLSLSLSLFLSNKVARISSVCTSSTKLGQLHFRTKPTHEEED